MRRLRFPIPVSIVLFVALTLAGTYYVRKGLLERAMIRAIENDDEGMIRGLARSWPCPARAKTTEGATALHWAAWTGDLEIARRCLDQGADVNAVTVYESRSRRQLSAAPLQLAARRGRVEVARLLIARGAIVDAGFRPWDDDTPLGLALTTGKLEMIRFLLDSGAKPQAMDGGLDRRFAQSVLAGRFDIARMLLPCKPNLDAPYLWTLTALQTAVIRRNRAAMEFLLAHGAGVNVRGPMGMTALHLAATCGDMGCLELLFAHGADLSSVDDWGRTPLRRVEDAISNAALIGTLRTDLLAVMMNLRKRGAKE